MFGGITFSLSRYDLCVSYITPWFVSNHTLHTDLNIPYLSEVINERINPSAWGHLNPSSYCDVGRLFYGVFKLWSKLQRKK